MKRMQAIIYGGGAQALEVYATDKQGRVVAPATARAKIVDLYYPEDAADSDRIVLAEDDATIDTTSTVITAAAGPSAADPRKIVVTSATGLTVGRTYALSAGGRTEAIEVDRIDGLNVYAVNPLRYQFAATTSSLIGLRATVTFPEARANDADEVDRRTTYAVDWTFTGVTGPTKVRTFARIERRGKAPRAVAADVFRCDPQLSTATHSRTVVEQHIAQADLELDALLLDRGDLLPDVHQGLAGRLAVAWGALELAYRVLGEQHEGRAAWAAGKAKEWRERVLSGRKADDHVETTRGGDKLRRTRTRTPLALI